MKKIYLIALVSIIYISSIIAQPSFTWAKKFGGNSGNTAYGITVDGSGSVYTTGFFQGTCDFDPGVGVFNLTSAGGLDVFISKLDALGNFVWAKKVGGTVGDKGNSITIDAAGNVLITGLFDGTVDFDPGAGVFNLSTMGGDDIFILKLDAAGNFIYAKQVGSSGNDAGDALQSDPSNNVYITGYYNGAADFDPGAGTFNMTLTGAFDSFVLKLDAFGNFSWAKKFGGASSEQGWGITIDGGGNVLTTGYFRATVDFDPGAGTFNMTAPAGLSDIYISKLDASGNFVWAKQMTGTGDDWGYTIKTDAANNVYSSGLFQSTVDFDPGAGTYTFTAGNGTGDMYISKLNSSGNFVWAKQITSSAVVYQPSLDLDINGNVCTVSECAGVTDMDPSISTYTLPTGAFLNILDNSGNFLYAGTISGASGLGIKLDQSRNIHFTGGFSASTDFNMGAGTFTMTNSGASDVFIAKYCQNPDQPTAISGSVSICAGSSPVYTISSIPGATSYTWTLPGGWSGAGTSNTINPTTGSSGTISVSGVNACGIGVSQNIVITVNPLPTITVNSGSICSGQTFTMIPSGASTYTFQGGSATVSPSSTTSYTVVGTSTAGCVSASPATSNVTVSPTPTISVNSGSICSGNSFTINPSGANTYTIQGGSAVVGPTANASYTVTGTSTAGCISASPATANVTVVTTPTVNAGASQTLTCANPTLSLGGSGVTSYSWTGPGIISGSNTANPVVNAAGTYSLVGNSVGCNSSNTATVTVASNTTVPSLTVAATNNTICSGNSVTLTASGANSYSWNTGPTTTTINVTPSITTVYNVSGTNTANGCSSILSKTITVNTTPTVSMAGGAICPGGSFTLSATSANTYTYSSGPVVSPTTNTTYSVTGTSTNGCVSNMAVATVTVTNNLTVTITGTNTVCSGQPINLTAGGAATYTWNTGATTNTIAPTPTANITYSVIGASGSCSNTALLSVTVNPLPSLTLTSTNSSAILCQGQTATLTATGANSYSWSTGPTTNTIAVSPSVTTTYTVTGTSAQGCSNSNTITQVVTDCTGLSSIAIAREEIKIYPNPTCGKITVEAGRERNFTILNVLGSEILKGKTEDEKFEINLEKESKGIYFIRIGTETRKIVKE